MWCTDHDTVRVRLASLVFPPPPTESWPIPPPHRDPYLCSYGACLSASVTQSEHLNRVHLLHLTEHHL